MITSGYWARKGREAQRRCVAEVIGLKSGSKLWKSPERGPGEPLGALGMPQDSPGAFQEALEPTGRPM